MHLYGYDRRGAQTLTAAERESLIELRRIQPSLLEMIRQQADYDAAFDLIHVRFIETWAGGADPNGFRYQCNESGIEARMPSGNQGRVTWRDIIKHARAEAVQPALF